MEERGQPAKPQRTPVDQLADGSSLSNIDPNDPAAPNYELVARLRGALGGAVVARDNDPSGTDRVPRPGWSDRPEAPASLRRGAVSERGRNPGLRAVAGRPDTLRGFAPGGRSPELADDDVLPWRGFRGRPVRGHGVFNPEDVRAEQPGRGQRELPAGAGVAVPDRSRRLRGGVPLGAGAGRHARRGHGPHRLRRRFLGLELRGDRGAPGARRRASVAHGGGDARPRMRLQLRTVRLVQQAGPPRGSSTTPLSRGSCVAGT